MNRTFSAGTWIGVLSGVLLGCREWSPAGAASGVFQPNVAGTVHTTFLADGESGQVEWFTVGAAGAVVGTGSVGASRGNPGDPGTMLAYMIRTCEAGECEVVEAGFGRIANSDFSGGREHLRVSTQTADNPDFEVFVGNGGLISVEWRSASIFVQNTNGVTEERFGPGPGSPYDYTLIRRSRGQSTWTTAVASGTVLGTAIEGHQSARIATNRQMTQEFIR